MITLNNILKEIENVPIDRLEEVYQFVHSLTPSAIEQSKDVSKKILSFGGIFSDMNEKDYKDYQNQIKETRKNLFDRSIDL